MQLGRNRIELERELEDLGQRCAQLADQIEVACRAHDAATVADLTLEIAQIEPKLEETSFLLSLIYDGLKMPAYG